MMALNASLLKSQMSIGSEVNASLQASVDIKGHTLGFTGDSYSMDNVTGMAMDAATAYQEPIGMSVSHDIHNNSFESVSSGS